MRAVAVAMCRPDEARAFCGRHAPSVTCLCDASKHAYAAYGLTRAGLREVFGPEVVAAGIRATLGGHVQGRTVGDPMMMPGTFAIDQAGIIHAAHYARHAGDQPDLRAMLAALYRPQ